MPAVNPETLGGVFDILLDINDRKSKGAYYTPREIVRYMCRESLACYLYYKLNKSVEQDALLSLMRDGGKLSGIGDNAVEIDDALANVKIFDPAVGPGVFPLGLMHEIVNARLALVNAGFIPKNSQRTAGEYKRQFIRNSLYGIDIERAAVEAAKQRLWLSVTTEKDYADSIKPFPELDENIVCGNSLLGDDCVDILSKKAGGFDIVIGNPPYIGEKGRKDIFAPVKRQAGAGRLGRFYQGKMDIFYFFFHLALDLLKPGGICAFITTNYYVTAAGGAKLRKDLKARAALLSLIDFNELRLFESARGHHSMITMLQKTSGPSNRPKCKCYKAQETGMATGKELQDIENGAGTFFVAQDDLYDGAECYIRNEDPAVAAVLKKIKEGRRTLGDICLINTGIQSGADKVTERHFRDFEIDARKNDGIFVLTESNPNDKTVLDEIRAAGLSRLLAPFYKSTDIRRYATETAADSYILYLDRSVKEISTLAPIERHLERFKTVLSRRREVENGRFPYFQLHWPREQAIFNGPKIVAPQRSPRNTFGYNEDAWYASADVYFITQRDQQISLKYILGLLNSSLCYFWLYHRGKRKGKALELYQTPLSEIPVAEAPKDVQNRIAEMVDRRFGLRAGCEDSEADELINREVYELYGVAGAMRVFIEKSFFC